MGEHVAEVSTACLVDCNFSSVMQLLLIIYRRRYCLAFDYLHYINADGMAVSSLFNIPNYVLTVHVITSSVKVE